MHATPRQKRALQRTVKSSNYLLLVKVRVQRAARNLGVIQL